MTSGPRPVGFITEIDTLRFPELETNLEDAYEARKELIDNQNHRGEITEDDLASHEDISEKINKAHNELFKVLFDFKVSEREKVTGTPVTEEYRKKLKRDITEYIENR